MPDTLLWEWNGVDTSQFEAAPMQESATWSTSLSVVPTSNNDCFEDNYLDFSSSVAANNGGAVWLAKDPLPLSGENRRYRIEYDGFSNSVYSGLALMADPAGGGHSLNAILGPTAGWKSRVDAGVHIQDASTLATPWGLKTMVHGNAFVLGKKVFGSPPEISVQHQVLGSGGADVEINTRFQNSAWSSLGAYPASWNGLDCLYWGLALQRFTSGLPFIRFATIRIWSFE